MNTLKMFDMNFFLKNNKNNKSFVNVYGVLHGDTERDINVTHKVEGLTTMLMDMVGVNIDGEDFISYGRLYVTVDSGLKALVKKQVSGKCAVKLKGYLIFSKGTPFLVNMVKLGAKKILQGVKFEKLNKESVFFPILYEAYNNKWDFVGVKDFRAKGYTVLGEHLYDQKGTLDNSLFVTTQDKVDAKLMAKNNMNLGVGKENTVVVQPQKNNEVHVSDIRFSLLEKQKEWDILGKELELCLEKLDDFKYDFKETLNIDSKNVNTELENLFNKLDLSWGKKRGMFTGRMLFTTALEKTLPHYKKFIKNNIDMYGKDWLKTCKQSTYKDKGNKFLKLLWESRLKLYFSVLDTLLSLRGRLLKAVDDINDDELVFHLIQRDPYYLGLYSFDFHIEDLDKLAKFKGVNTKTNIRNALLCHIYMMSLEDTIIEYGRLATEVKNGYVVLKSTYNEIRKEGYMVNKDRLESLAYYLGCSDINVFKFPKSGWVLDNDKYYLSTNKVSNAVDDYIALGLGVRLDLRGKRYVMDYTTAYKENYIVNKVYALSKKVNDVKDEDIEKCIEEFESMKAKELGISDFRLEDNQKKAVYLIRNRVMCLTGPAGSGKTTTAEAILYACEKLLGLDSNTIMFCAPTGKAANRLKEVVKRKTSTIHSLFRIGGKANLFKERNVETREDIKLLFVDESSMIDTDLMFQMLEKVDNDTMIYFLGDIEQLPPIGLGKPFSNLLDILPKVKLNVTKRASDKSGITRNANKIIKNEQGDLIKTDDFIIMDIEKEKVVDRIISICKSLKGTFEEDDIQVITPINKGEWGTKELNKQLQKVFNVEGDKKRSIEIEEYGGLITRFRVGDRVIHTKKNDYNMPRFEKTGSHSFSLMGTKGIMNGDVGKIEGIYTRKEIQIDADEEFIEMFLCEEDEDRVYVAVKYSDFDTNSGNMYDFIVLYDAEIVSEENKVFKVKEGNIGYLDLAYALTVHKMQGSQSKVVLGVLYKVGRVGDFISRNMIYTLITRAQKVCYLLGDISGDSSSVNIGRRVERSSKRMTLMDLLV